MKQTLLTISLIMLFFSACQKSGEKSGGLLSSDDTAEAVELINEANAELRKIRAIYKDNLGKAEEIKTAMGNKEIDKVKELASNVVLQIDEGLTLGEAAYTKIEKARDLNINDTYREYLDIKAQALRKQLDAFEFRKKTAQILRDSFGGKGVEIETVKAQFKQADDNFMKLMDDGRTLSRQATDLATEAAQRSNK